MGVVPIWPSAHHGVGIRSLLEGAAWFSATPLTLGFVALNADGNGPRVVGFVAFRHDIGIVCCRLYRVLAFFRTGREPVHRYRRRCTGTQRGSVDQAEHGGAQPGGLALRGKKK